jgi:hypothetical protein
MSRIGTTAARAYLNAMIPTIAEVAIALELAWAHVVTKRPPGPQNAQAGFPAGVLATWRL